MPGNHHVQKPTFMNQISLGNILSAIAIIAGGLGVWVTLNVQLARAETAIHGVKSELATTVAGLDQKFSSTVSSIERRQDRSEQRIEKQLEQVNAKLDRLIDQR